MSTTTNENSADTTVQADQELASHEVQLTDVAAGKVRSLLDRSDARRVEALTQMFARFGFPSPEDMTRAKVLYYMQLGYDMAEPNETYAHRLEMVPYYLKAFTGIDPLPEELDAFAEFTRKFWDV